MSFPKRAMALVMAAVLGGCEDDSLFVEEDPPDTGLILDAAPLPDVGFPMDPPGAGFPDAEPPPADVPVYIHTGTTLYAYDPNGNIATPIADFFDDGGPVEGMVDIAIDREGRMFGGTIDQKVYVIDPVTGRSSFRFEFDDILHGLTFLPDGRLVVAGERISVVSPQTGRTLLEFAAANQYRTSGDIVGLPDGFLYWTVRGEDSGDSDNVVRIDPATGDTTVIGEAQLDRIFGLGFAFGSLYGFSSTGFVVTLDPTSGTVTALEELEGAWWGATTNPVLWE